MKSFLLEGLARNSRLPEKKPLFSDRGAAGHELTGPWPARKDHFDFFSTPRVSNQFQLCRVYGSESPIPLPGSIASKKTIQVQHKTDKAEATSCIGVASAFSNGKRSIYASPERPLRGLICLTVGTLIMTSKRLTFPDSRVTSCKLMKGMEIYLEVAKFRRHVYNTANPFKRRRKAY